MSKLKIKIFDENDNMISEHEGDLALFGIGNFNEKKGVVLAEVLGAHGNYVLLSRLLVGIAGNLHTAAFGSRVSRDGKGHILFEGTSNSLNADDDGYHE